MSTAAQLKPLARCTLEIVKGPHAGQKFDFEKSTITIGRDPENDISLSKDPRVSRQHAEIKQDLGQFQVVNLSQRNFVLINGTRVTSDQLPHKAVLQIGETEMKFFIHDNTSSLEPVASPMQMDPPQEKTNIAPLRAVAPQGANPSAMTSKGPQAPAPRPSVAQAPAGWQQPQPQTQTFAHMPPAAGINPRIKFYGTLAVIGLLIALVAVKGGRMQRAVEKPFRTAEELNAQREETENEIKAFKERQTHMQSTVFQKAYENFLRGYRDYRQGQYSRAQDAFQVVLNLDPGNELALRYYNLSKIKYDELVKFHMLQGRRYLEKQSYRMCKSNFQTVMTMLGSAPSNPEYIEAKELHERCASALEGRF